ncbi:type II secretion system protein GspG [Luteolibacter soli]|uniref:Type II secretion system protein GspG n=1 Tax=Luteolibacter soli TaxID=3135280 RepID=A0ABU9AQT6_9BACT
MVCWRARLVLVVVMWGGVAAAHTTRPLQDFIAIGSALKMFKVDAGRYPTEEEGLRALVEGPVNWPKERKWPQVMKKIPTDPWGHPYFYIASPSAGEDYGLYSGGKDGVSYSKGNDPDDWNTWSDHDPEEHGWRDSWMNRLKKNPVPFSLAIVLLVFAVVEVIRVRRGLSRRT